MTDQIASITLRADVSDLKTASNELDKLGQAAATAVDKADDLNSVFRAGAESVKQGSESIKEQQTALKGLLENIDPVNKALNRLDEQQAALRNFQTKGFLDGDDFQHYNRILDDTRLKLTDTGEAAARTQAQLAATQAAEKQSAALKNLLGSIDPTIRAFNSLDEQHAQLVAHFEAGRINGAQFEHFNDILNQTRQRLSSVADVLPEALSRQELAARRAGISVGQYNQAMHTLPAQFTDIATQLAGGQSPFLILLQQGGQIKDSFGGVKGAISGVTSYIASLVSLLNPVTVGLAAVAGGFAYLAYQAYENNKQIEGLNQALAKTGNISGKSAEGLQALSRQLASARDVSKSVAIDVVTKATALGASADQISQFADTALLMTRTTGQSVDELLKQFARIGKDPVLSLVSLNEQYHFATAALYEHVKALTDAGDSAGAARAIIDQLASSQKNFGDVSVSYLRLTGNWWDDLLDKVGRYKLSLDDLKATPSAGLKEQGIRTGGSELPGWDYVTREAAKPQIPTVEVTKAGLQDLINLQKENAANTKQFNDEQLKFRMQMDASEKSLATNAQKRTDEAEKYAKAVKAGYITQVEADRHLAQFNERYKDPKTPKAPAVKVDAGDRTIENYQAQSRTLIQTLETLRQTGETQVKNTELSKQQSRFAELDEAARTRVLTTQEHSLLASREAILNAARVVDQKNKEIEAQQKINGLAQQANKYVTQMSEKTAALQDSGGLSNRQAQRLREEAQLRQGWLNGGGDLEDAGYQKELSALRKYYAEEDKLRGDWKAGALNGWNEYLDAATNTYSAVNSVAGSALTGLSDMLTDLMTTGKASIEAFGMSMLKMIADVVNRLLVAYAVQAAMGWISGSSGGGSTPSGAYNNAAAGVSFDSGGYTGTGGKYEPAGIVHKDEFVFTKEATNRIGVDNLYRLMNGGPLGRYATGGSVGGSGAGSSGGGSGINVDIYVDNRGNTTSEVTGGSNGDAAARALAERMKQYVTEGINRALRDDGAIGGSFVKK